MLDSEVDGVSRNDRNCDVLFIPETPMNDYEDRSSTLSAQQETSFLQWRLLTVHLAALAERLAIAAGEQPTRPLTAPQLLRAIQVLDEETQLVATSMRPALPI